MAYSNVQNLNTYLSAVVVGSPATTATALLDALTPVFFNFTGDTTPHYGPGTPTAIQTLAGTQGKYSAILYPSTGGAVGITMGDTIGLLSQGFKEINASAPVTFTVTTNGSGVATQSIASLGLTNTPRVVVCPTNAGPQTTNAQVSAKSNTSISVYTTITQQVLLGIVNPTTPVSCSVDIIVYPLG